MGQVVDFKAKAAEIADKKLAQTDEESLEMLAYDIMLDAMDLLEYEGFDIREMEADLTVALNILVASIRRQQGLDHPLLKPMEQMNTFLMEMYERQEEEDTE